MYELTVTQGVVKLYDINGGQRNEQPVQPDGTTQILLRLVGKSDQRPDLKFPLRRVCPYCNQLRLIFENCKRRLKRSRAGKAVGYLFGSLLGALMAILTLSAALKLAFDHWLFASEKTNTDRRSASKLRSDCHFIPGRLLTV